MVFARAGVRESLDTSWMKAAVAAELPGRRRPAFLSTGLADVLAAPGLGHHTTAVAITRNAGLALPVIPYGAKGSRGY